MLQQIRFMIIAGDPSGDVLGADLVNAIRNWWYNQQFIFNRSSITIDFAEPLFFGAGGPRMKDAGVNLQVQLTDLAVTGFTDVLKNYLKFVKIFKILQGTAFKGLPDVIICIDFSGFNLRFARSIKKKINKLKGPFFNWSPKIIQYVSPQLWASRAGRITLLENYVDLLLSIFPFEKDWYKTRSSKLRVEYIGHPFSDKYPSPKEIAAKEINASEKNIVLLLPGSRIIEIKRHLPILLKSWHLLKSKHPQLSALIVVPNHTIREVALNLGTDTIPIQVGNLASALERAAIALCCTGTATIECAWYLVPAVTFYKTSPLTYLIGKTIIKINTLTMPNILANETIYPEFIQYMATPENIANAADQILSSPDSQKKIKEKLLSTVMKLYQPGVMNRAAQAVWQVLMEPIIMS